MPVVATGAVPVPAGPGCGVPPPLGDPPVVGGGFEARVRPLRRDGGLLGGCPDPAAIPATTRAAAATPLTAAMARYRVLSRSVRCPRATRAGAAAALPGWPR